MSYVLPPNKHLFNEQVWELVRQIPYGRVATYGQIATMIPQPEDISRDDYQTFGARWVGLAMGACPDDVPWQRVVNSQGKISHQTHAGTQKQLLEAEGVLFTNEKLSLKEYKWAGPGQSGDFRQERLF